MGTRASLCRRGLLLFALLSACVPRAAGEAAQPLWHKKIEVDFGMREAWDECPQAYFAVEANGGVQILPRFGKNADSVLRLDPDGNLLSTIRLPPSVPSGRACARRDGGLYVNLPGQVLCLNGRGEKEWVADAPDLESSEAYVAYDDCFVWHSRIAPKHGTRIEAQRIGPDGKRQTSVSAPVYDSRGLCFDASYKDRVDSLPPEYAPAIYLPDGREVLLEGLASNSQWIVINGQARLARDMRYDGHQFIELISVDKGGGVSGLCDLAVPDIDHRPWQFCNGVFYAVMEDDKNRRLWYYVWTYDLKEK